MYNVFLKTPIQKEGYFKYFLPFTDDFPIRTSIYKKQWIFQLAEQLATHWTSPRSTADAYAHCVDLLVSTPDRDAQLLAVLICSDDSSKANICSGSLRPWLDFCSPQNHFVFYLDSAWARDTLERSEFPADLDETRRFHRYRIPSQVPSALVLHQCFGIPLRIIRRESGAKGLAVSSPDHHDSSKYLIL